MSPSPPSASITLLQQREIEARVLAPFVDALISRFDKDSVLDVLREVIRGLSQETGRSLAASDSDTAGGTTPSLGSFARVLESWRADGSLELEMIASDEHRLEFDVHRCRFAEMYEQLGIEELGGVLSCARDHALIEGYSEEYELSRGRTILDGDRCCDFRFRKK